MNNKYDSLNHINLIIETQLCKYNQLDYFMKKCYFLLIIFIYYFFQIIKQCRTSLTITRKLTYLIASHNKHTDTFLSLEAKKHKVQKIFVQKKSWRIKRKLTATPAEEGGPCDYFSWKLPGN